jgi:hypothetical protein
MGDREEDLKMLRDILAASPNEEEELRFNARVFREWLESLEARKMYALSTKQRAWLRDSFEKVIGTPQYENLVSRGLVPRGREVPLPPVLDPRYLPKKPPPRRRNDDE